MAAADWRQEYLAGIKEAEKQQPVDRELIEAYSQLCDRLSILEAEKALLQAQLSSSSDNNKNLSTSSSSSRNNTKSPSPARSPHNPPPPPPLPPPPGPDPDQSSTETHHLRLQLQLSESLRAKSTFQARLQKAEEELARLRNKSSRDAKTITQLTAENRAALRKLQDREFELREKRKLVADVQDELAVLNMQLDMVERQRAEKEAENKQLIDRFMRRIGQEAEAMNLANEPLFSKKGGKK
ncbi:autophagy protein 16 [Cladorrhinum sp. PSN332]|nr:autophagy protein 16 [Cladorrhinum sp. PSN332]